MSNLFSTEREAPNHDDYQRALAIADAERCDACEGTGVVRLMHSMTGRGDWRVCFICSGRGKKK